MAADRLKELIVGTAGVFFNSHMAARAMPTMGGGMGIITRRALGAQETIAELPARSFLTAPSARALLQSLTIDAKVGALDSESDAVMQQAEKGNEIELAIAKLPAIESIAAALLVTRHRDGLADGVDVENVPPWMALWVDYLPRRYDTFVEMPEGVAEQCLTCPKLRRAQHRERKAAALRGSAAAKVARHICPRSDPSEVEGHAMWAVMSLMSRGFAWHDEHWAMIPWMDYFNYATDANIRAAYSVQRNVYLFSTIRAVGEGEELLLHYGEYSDAELALWYGFVLTGSRGLSNRAAQAADTYRLAPYVNAEAQIPPEEESWVRLLLRDVFGVTSASDRGEESAEEDTDGAAFHRTLEGTIVASQGLQAIARIAATSTRSTPVDALCKIAQHFLKELQEHKRTFEKAPDVAEDTAVIMSRHIHEQQVRLLSRAAVQRDWEL